MTTPTFSIFVAAPNDGAGLLEASITSLRAQSFRGWELFIIHPTEDNQGNNFRQPPDKRFRFLPSGTGTRAAALNRATALAKGKYLLFLQDNLILDKEHLAETQKAMASASNRFGAAITGIRLEYLNPQVKPGDEPLYVENIGAGALAPPALSMAANPVASLTVRRNAFREIGGFNETAGPDYLEDFLHRLSYLRRIFATKVPAPVLRHTIGEPLPRQIRQDLVAPPLALPPHSPDGELLAGICVVAMGDQTQIQADLRLLYPNITVRTTLDSIPAGTRLVVFWQEGFIPFPGALEALAKAMGNLKNRAVTSIVTDEKGSKIEAAGSPGLLTGVPLDKLWYYKPITVSSPPMANLAIRGNDAPRFLSAATNLPDLYNALRRKKWALKIVFASCLKERPKTPPTTIAGLPPTLCRALRIPTSIAAENHLASPWFTAGLEQDFIAPRVLTRDLEVPFRKVPIATGKTPAKILVATVGPLLPTVATIKRLQHSFPWAEVHVFGPADQERTLRSCVELDGFLPHAISSLTANAAGHLLAAPNFPRDYDLGLFFQETTTDQRGTEKNLGFFRSLGIQDVLRLDAAGLVVHFRRDQPPSAHNASQKQEPPDQVYHGCYLMVCTRDRFQLTKGTLDSILRNTDLQQCRLIVTDNGSSDEQLLEYLHTLHRQGLIHRLLLNKPETVPGFQKPMAVRQAYELFALETQPGDGWAFGFIDNDARVEKDWLPTSLKALSGGIYDKGIGCIVPWDRWAGKGEHFSLNGIDLVRRDTTGSLCWLMRRDFFSLFGWPAFDAPSQDEYYVNMFRQLNYTFGILNPPLVFHTGWDQSTWTELRGKPIDSARPTVSGRQCQ